MLRTCFLSIFCCRIDIQGVSGDARRRHLY
jgi:hypothetical protein